MNAWEILGIEPTSDKKEIKRAYARLLKQYHPEDNPEEFKQIQAAYSFHNPISLIYRPLR